MKQGRKRGRNCKYQTHVEPYIETIIAWRKEGYTIEQIANKLGISKASLCAYGNKYIELMDALKTSKEYLVTKLKQSLYKKALGFEYEETKTSATVEKDENGADKIGSKRRVEKTKKYYAPDVAALVFALCNLAPDEWKNKQQLEHSGSITNKPDLSGLTEKELKALAKKYEHNPE